MTNIIDSETKKRWTSAARYRAESWLANMIELREIVELCKRDRSATAAEVYAEAAPCFGISAGALQNKMSVLRSFSYDKLHYWIVESRFSVDAIRAVLYAFDNGDVRGDVIEYIDGLIANGNANGEVPTRAEVDALIAEHTGRSNEYFTNIAIGAFLRRLKIDAGRVDAFVAELKALLEKYA